MPSTAGSPPTRLECAARRTSRGSNGRCSTCGNFFVGEEVVDLADAEARAAKWCAQTAGQRIHGTTQARPAEVFTEHEASVLLRLPEPYDVPIFTRVKVHRDFHIEVGKALTPPRRHTSGSTWTCVPTRTWSSCSTPDSWSRCTPGNAPAAGGPTPKTSRPPRLATRCVTWTGSSPPPTTTAKTSASTPS